MGRVTSRSPYAPPMPHANYTDEQKEGLKQWIAQWRITGPLLEAQREVDIRAADTVRDMRVLAGLAQSMANRDHAAAGCPLASMRCSASS